MTKTLHAQIPATSANVGSGFDAVGIALTLYNDIYFTEEPGKDTITVEIEGLGANKLPKVFDENMVGQAMKAVAPGNGPRRPSGQCGPCHLRWFGRFCHGRRQDFDQFDSP